jgi:sulfur carrier protein
MEIIINGQPKTFASPINLQDLITTLQPDSRFVIAELNGQIMKKPTWESTLVNGGDKIELVNFVGGG